MPRPADLSDFEEQLEHLCSEAVHEMGRESAKLQGQFAATGGVNNSRSVFVFLEALEKAWSMLVTSAVTDADRFAKETSLTRDALAAAALTHLNDAFPKMVTASRVETARGRFQNQSMLSGVTERIETLRRFAPRSVRQFELQVFQQSSAAGGTHYSVNVGGDAAAIQQGSPGAKQTVTVAGGDNVFPHIEAKIRERETDEAKLAEIIELLKRMEAAQGSQVYVGLYSRFMALVADHMTVLSPYLPALAQLLPS